MHFSKGVHNFDQDGKKRFHTLKLIRTELKKHESSKPDILRSYENSCLSNFKFKAQKLSTVKVRYNVTHHT